MIYIHTTSGAEFTIGPKIGEWKNKSVIEAKRLTDGKIMFVAKDTLIPKIQYIALENEDAD